MFPCAFCERGKEVKGEMGKTAETSESDHAEILFGQNED
jgi:hypothetical protein